MKTLYARPIALGRVSTPDYKAVNVALELLQSVRARLQAVHHKLSATLMN